jgi:hypothetical protein
MLGSKILEVAISLAFIYLLLSVICSAVKEVVAALVKLRSWTMKRAIGRMLGDPKIVGYAKNFLEHPLIQANGKKPSYIAPSTFSTVLLDVLAPGATAPVAGAAAPGAAFVKLRSIVGALPDSKAKTSVLALLDAADYDIVKARQNIEGWFNDAMERTSGQYKRMAQCIIVVPAIIVTLYANVDSISIANRLYRDDSLRALAVATAQNYTNFLALASGTSSNASADVWVTVSNAVDHAATAQKQLQEMQLPIGWTNSTGYWEMNAKDLSSSWLGMLITIVAISMGAPFWFDLLSLLVNPRLSGDPPDKNTKTTDQKVKPN